MADGYARVTGKPGVAMVVPGPGVLNATAGIATAYACSSPVLLLAGQIDSSLLDDTEYGALHEIPDQTGVLEKLCKWVGTARSAHEIPDLVSLAFYHMSDGVPGPVALEVPPNVLAEMVAPRRPTHFIRPEVEVSPEDIRAIRAALETCQRPYILVGGGAISSRAQDQIIALAEQLNCPIIQTRNGRGAVSAEHSNVFDPHTRQSIIKDADLAIVLGSRMGTGAGGHIPLGTEKVVSINADPAHLIYPRPRSEVAVVGDLSALLRTLLNDFEQRPLRTQSTWTEDEFQAIRSEGAERLDDIRPQLEYLKVISQTFPKDTVLVSEYTQVGYVASITYPASSGPGSFISPGYQGTLGYGFATAIGAQIGAGARRVISITGDGGFAWTMPELATLQRYQVPLVTVLFNDGKYGNVYRSQKYSYQGRIIGSELTNPDFEQLAAAHGVEAHRVTSPEGLESALQRALDGNPRPVLIEVVVSEFPSPWSHFDEPGQ